MEVTDKENVPVRGKVVVSKQNLTAHPRVGSRRGLGNGGAVGDKARRQKLLRTALTKGSSAASHEALFAFDRAALAIKCVPAEKHNEKHLALLENDTARLDDAKGTYAKLRLWLALAQYVEHQEKGGAVAARAVFDRAFSLGFAKYFHEFYEAWALLEFRIEGEDSAGAKRVVQLAVQNKVIDQSAAKETLVAWSTKRVEVDGDETIAFTTFPAASQNSNSEPTIVLSSANITTRNTRTSAAATSAAGKKKPGLRLPTTKGNLSKLGRAQRVQRVVVNAELQDEHQEKQACSTSNKTEDKNNNNKDDTSNDQTVELFPYKPTDSKKSSIRNKIGDISYILNWEGGANATNNNSGDEPTTTLAAASTARRERDEETITFKSGARIGEGVPPQATLADKQNAGKTITFKRPGSSRTHGSSGSAGNASHGIRSMEDTVQIQQSSTGTLHYNPTTSYQAGRSSINSTHSGGQQPRLSTSTVGGAMAEVQAFHQSLLSPKNLFIVNGHPYLRLAVIGRGGSSKVFKVLAISDKEPQIYALKRIKLQRVDEGSIGSFLNEIKLMEKLRGNPNIIQLLDSQVNLEERVIYMVMEHGEIDLNSMLTQQRKLAGQHKGEHQQRLNHESAMVGNLSINLVRLVWMNMLEAVRAIHEERIVHGDLKPANFLFVKGKLKLIDFGIAKTISNDTTNIHRDTQVGTLNYMSPETIIDTNSTAGARPRIGAPGMKLKQGRASDIWSMGCILYQMVYGQTPFHNLKLIQKIHCISDPKHVIQYPPLTRPNPDLMDAVKRCLQFSPTKRAPIVGSATEGGLLDHPFLNPLQGLVGGGSNVPNEQHLKPLLRAVVNDVLAHSNKLAKMKAGNPGKFDEVLSSLSGGFSTQLEKIVQQSKAQDSPAAAPQKQQRRTRTNSSSPRLHHTLEPLAEGDEPDSETAENWQQQQQGEAAAHKQAALKPTATQQKPALQASLKQSIMSGMNGLKSLENSSSARFMRPKGTTPEKDRDFASLISEAMDRKREMILLHDQTLQEMDRSGHTWDFLPSFPGIGDDEDERLPKSTTP